MKLKGYIDSVFSTALIYTFLITELTIYIFQNSTLGTVKNPKHFFLKDTKLFQDKTAAHVHEKIKNIF